MPSNVFFACFLQNPAKLLFIAQYLDRQGFR